MTEIEARAHARRRPSLKDHARSALRQRFAERGWSAYRADQVATWLYKQDATSLDEMTNLPAALRGEIAAEFEVENLVVEATQRSVDGTQKLLLRAFDGARIEAVLIPEERRHTLCVSTQVGCPLACSFCATGALGFTRNLSAGEIVDQVLQARRRIPQGEVLTNLVFMGMGEPLLNLPSVSEAIRILVDPKGLALAPRRITVSTAGVLPQIGPLLAVAPIHLAVSLHATTDEVRDVLVPLNKRFPLAELMDTLRREPQLGRRRPVFFEYTLMEGVNDSLEDARRMPRLLAGIPAKVNVIPMNPHADAPYRPPGAAVVDRFTAALHEAGLRVTLRRDRGRDIDAACGQLANRAAGATPTANPGPDPARAAGPETRPESLQEGLLGNRWGPRDAGAPLLPLTESGGRGPCSTRSVTSTANARSSTSCSSCSRSSPATSSSSSGITSIEAPILPA